MVKRMQEKFVDLTYIPWLIMVITSPNIWYGHFEPHTFVNFVSPSTSFVQLTYLLQDGFVKLCNDQSMFFHITFETPHIILYLS